MGDKVKEGELLALIDTPELDQELDQARTQLTQARAQLTQAQANRELSKANLHRSQLLSPAGIVSQADLDQRQAQAQVDEAVVSVSLAAITAQEANIRRLMQLKSFSRITAPFAGTVTQRWVENGALVTAGNSQPLYKVAAMDPVRVLIQVPQNLAPSIHPGESAKEFSLKPPTSRRCRCDEAARASNGGRPTPRATATPNRTRGGTRKRVAKAINAMKSPLPIEWEYGRDPRWSVPREPMNPQRPQGQPDPDQFDGLH